MKKQDKAIAGLLIGGGIVLILSMIANNPRISPLWRHVARTAEGDVFKHVINGDLVTLLA
jgi:hypothetical protein